jgi:hypothetical protein
MAALPAVAPDAASDPSFAELLALRPHLTMDPFAGLMMEEVPLARIAAEVGSPTWVYSAGALRRRLGALQSALTDAGLPAEVHFAVKANPSLTVLRVLAAASSPRANYVSPSPPASPPATSSSPASARPCPRSASRSPRTSSRSMPRARRRSR